MGFNLADILKDVSDSDTGREQIEYISLELIDQDPNNFYELSEVPALADNISLCGLQQPIRVRKQENGRYQIVSGHRRRAALEMLVIDGYEKWQEAPCIVEQDAVSPTLQQLRLIYANANTRKMTSAELGEQAKQVEELLYRLKEEGYDFPGRMRDHVAEAVKLSKTKLARLKVIRENLIKDWEKLYKKNHLAESVAYELAQLSAERQKLIWDTRKDDFARRHISASLIDRYAERFKLIEKLKCPKTKKKCDNCEQKICAAVRIDHFGYFECYRCCSDCSRLLSCRYACPKMADKTKQLRAERKENRQAEQIAKEEKEKPTIDFIRTVYDRVRTAREKTKTSIQDYFDLQGKYLSTKNGDKFEQLEQDFGKITVNTNLPFGHSLTASGLMILCRVADGLGCSVDYLLGRTNRMEFVPETDTDGSQKTVPESGTYWNIDAPEVPGDYILMLGDPYSSEPKYEKWEWNGAEWRNTFGAFFPDIDGEIRGWIPVPKMPGAVSNSGTGINDSCITGMSPTGYCGAAAYCNTEHTCCLQCYNTSCNGRCGWAEEVGDG